MRISVSFPGGSSGQARIPTEMEIVDPISMIGGGSLIGAPDKCHRLRTSHRLPMYLCTCHFLVEHKSSTEYTIYVCNGSERAADFLVEIDIFECTLRCAIRLCSRSLSAFSADKRRSNEARRSSTF